MPWVEPQIGTILGPERMLRPYNSSLGVRRFASKRQLYPIEKPALTGVLLRGVWGIVLTNIYQDWLVARGLRFAWGGVACLLTVILVTATEAVAQSAPTGAVAQITVPGPQVFYSGVEPLAATIGRIQSDPRPTSTEGKFQFFDWLLSGGVGWGGSYDS